MWITLMICFVSSSKINHYEKGDLVIIWFGEYSQYANPFAHTSFFSIFECINHFKRYQHKNWFGEDIEGYNLIDSGMEVAFLHDSTSTNFCNFNLTVEKAQLLNKYIKKGSFLNIYIDGLPIKAPIGIYNQNEDIAVLFTLFNITLMHNHDKIIAAKIHMDLPILLNDTSLHKFYYQVNWKFTNELYEERYDQVLEFEFFERKSLHYTFYIINAYCIVVYLVAIKMIRIHISEETLPGNTVCGWKKLENYFCVEPKRLGILRFIVSSGCHFSTYILLLIYSIWKVEAYKSTGLFGFYVVYEYFLLSSIVGFLHNEITAKYKVRTNCKEVSISMLLFPFIIFALIFVVYGTENKTIGLKVLIYFSNFYVPFYFIGYFSSQLLRRIYPAQDYSNKEKSLNQVKRPWYTSNTILIMFSGILPFITIYPSVYSLTSAFLYSKIYYDYIFLLISYAMFLLSCVCVSISSAFISLNFENCHWQWLSTFTGGSVGGYFFIYFIFIYSFRSNFEGIYQGIRFISFSLFLSLIVSLIGASTGYLSTYLFVKNLYSNIKSE